MTAQTRSTLKGVFETGDVPSGTNFADLIDSFLSLTDTTAQSLTSQLTVTTLEATTEVSAVAVITSALTVNGPVTAKSVSAQTMTVSAGTFTTLLVTTLTVSALATVQATASVVSDQSGPMAVPGTAAGYITVNVCGQTVGIPYFKVA